MFIGVVSDTHGRIHATTEVVRILADFDLELVLHCGDVGSPAIVPLFSQWPTHFVSGNVDRVGPLHEAVTAAGQIWHGQFGHLELAAKRVAFLHGDDQQRLSEAVQDNQWDLVCFGHTHSATQFLQGSTLALNPGPLGGRGTYSLAVVELPAMEVTIVPV